MIERHHGDQFERLLDYGAEVQKKMSGSSFIVKRVYLMLGENFGRFKIVYVYLQPLKVGFTTGCRPIIGLGGCFLKGPFGGGHY